MEAATGVDFDTEPAAMERLRLPARIKGGGIKRATYTRRPAFLGALLDILPIRTDKKPENGEDLPGYYSEQLTEAIGKGAYDAEGHRNENIWPFLEASKEAWTQIRKEAMENYGLTERSDQEEWGKLGPLAEPTPTNAKKQGSGGHEKKAGR